MTTFEASNNTSQLRLKEIHGNLWRFMAGFWILWRLACYDFMVIQCYPAQGPLPLDQNDDLYDDGQAHWCLSAEAWSCAALAFLLPIFTTKFKDTPSQMCSQVSTLLLATVRSLQMDCYNHMKFSNDETPKQIWQRHLCVPTNQDKTKINWNYTSLYIDYNYS